MMFNSVRCVEVINGFLKINALAITGVMLIPLFPRGYIPWRGGSHEHISTMRARYFQILQIMGAKISAWSLHTQNGIGSGPVAVFFKCVKQFCSCLSVILGTWTPLLPSQLGQV